MKNLRIRRCNGNKNAWLLCFLRDDGTESDSYGSFTTSYSVDSLLRDSPAHIRPAPDDKVELLP